MADRNIGTQTPKQNDQISLKELVLKLQDWFWFFCRKWLVILGAVLLGGICGLLYTTLKPTNYTATLNFVMDDQSSSAGGGLGAAANIAAQLGINLGGLGNSGGLFEGDNIIEFLKSRSMIDKTLLTAVTIEGKRELLVDRYVDYNGLREKWASKGQLQHIQFQDTTGVFLQDSLLSGFHKQILKKNLTINKPNKQLNIIAIEMETPDEAFSKAFVEALIENASDFYIQTRTQKAQENLTILTHQVDSVRDELNRAIGGVAAAVDANPNPNRAFQSLRVGSQQRTVDVQANTAILTELVKNQELAKITLRNERPLIHALDRPILPLENDKVGKVTAIVIGGILSGVLCALVLMLKRIYGWIMADER